MKAFICKKKKNSTHDIFFYLMPMYFQISQFNREKKKKTESVPVSHNTIITVGDESSNLLKCIK